MSDLLQIRDIAAHPGEKQAGFLQIGQTPSLPVDLPLGIVNGAKPGPTLCVIAGLHAAEFTIIEAATRLYREIDPKSLTGSLLIVPVANTPAFQQGNLAYLSPLDNMNLNRLFPGDPNGSISQRTVYVLFHEIILLANYLIDLHCGDLGELLCPYSYFVTGTDNPDAEVQSKQLAALFAPSYIARGTIPGMAVWEATARGIPSILPEAGEMGLYEEPDIQFHMTGFHNIMTHLGMLDGTPIIHHPTEFYDVATVTVNHGGVYQPFFRPGDRIQKGQLLATVKSIFGDLREELLSPIDGIIKMAFPKRVKTTGEKAFLIWDLNTSTQG